MSWHIRAEINGAQRNSHQNSRLCAARTETLYSETDLALIGIYERAYLAWKLKVTNMRRLHVMLDRGNGARKEGLCQLNGHEPNE